MLDLMRPMTPARAAGFALVETMVTVVVVAFGLSRRGLSRSFVTEVEATRHTGGLLQDMVTRIEANRGNAAAYVTGDAGITGYITTETAGITATATEVCNPAASLADRDRCEWGQLLAGANEQIDTRNAGVLVGAIGCVYEIDAFNRIYAVSIAWQGMNAGAAPLVDNNFAPNGCGRDRFGNENQRRVMTMPLRIAVLNAAP
jgi:Tfp pilus assembly protein PilV